MWRVWFVGLAISCASLDVHQIPLQPPHDQGKRRHPLPKSRNLVHTPPSLTPNSPFTPTPPGKIQMTSAENKESGADLGTKRGSEKSKRYAIHTNEPVRRAPANPHFCEAASSTHREWVLRARPVSTALPCRLSTAHIHRPHPKNARPDPGGSWCHPPWRRTHPGNRSTLPGAINSRSVASSCHCPGITDTEEGNIPTASGSA